MQEGRAMFDLFELARVPVLKPVYIVVFARRQNLKLAW